MKAIWALCWAVALGQACTLVDGERILGGDLARADARFRQIPADYVAGFAPKAGVQRVFEVRDLVRVARGHGLEIEGLRPLCFERRTMLLTEAQLRQALGALLPEGATLEIVDFSRNTLPAGTLEFRLRDLPKPPNGQRNAAVVWRGRAVYGSGSSAITWAKVRVLVWEKWVETAQAIPSGRAIERGDLVSREEQRFPFAAPPVRDPDGVIGMTVSRWLPKGQVLMPAHLTAPADVQRGDLVSVKVESGAVRLGFSGRALGSGKVNDSVLVELDSGKRLKAQIEGKGKVLIDADLN